jgi:hypothetical protein
LQPVNLIFHPILEKIGITTAFSSKHRVNIFNIPQYSVKEKKIKNKFQSSDPLMQPQAAEKFYFTLLAALKNIYHIH